MANWKPKTHELRHRVELVERQKSRDGSGYTGYTEVVRGSCWAAVDTWRSGLQVAEDAETAGARIRVRLRWRDWIREGLFVRWHGEMYEVHEVDRYDFKNDFLCLECRAAKVGRA